MKAQIKYREKAECLIKNSVDFFSAAKEGDVHKLMKAKAGNHHVYHFSHSLNLKNHECKTTLMIAAEGGHKKLVGFLLDFGAHLFIRDNTGKMAFDHASSKEIFDLLRTARLHRSIIRGDLESVKVLIHRGYNIKGQNRSDGADVNIQDVNGLTSFHFSLFT